jgi:hypothetical protein
MVLGEQIGVTDLHWKITVIQKMMPCNETTAIAAAVILPQKSVEDASILQTNMSIDNFVRVHAAANINSVQRTIFRPRVTSVGGISYYLH